MLEMRAFPRDLAKVVFNRWNTLVFGEYKVPPCPPQHLLRELLEIAYLAAGIAEEGRYPSFNIVAMPEGDGNEHYNIHHRWPFDQSRMFSIGELRRLAPAVDVKKSAIWAQWDATNWRIAGLVDLGTSWHRARIGLEYRYHRPSCLFVQVDRPSRLRVYQGDFHVATLSDGIVEGRAGFEMHLFLHPPTNAGLLQMDDDLVRPKVEEPQEFVGFEFIALWNTYAAIANSISLDGHGGTLIITSSDGSPPTDVLNIKYPQSSLVLRSSFVNFINARHVIGDLIAREENKEKVSAKQVSLAQLKMDATYEELVEATRFVAHLARCDGAIVISQDLRFVGFGAEIRAEFKKGTEVLDVVNEMQSKYRRLVIDEFGMRHRSAVKLASQAPSCRILVVSQDGPITGVWSDHRKVFVKRGAHLINLNMPWA
jgi:hypothetical protein